MEFLCCNNLLYEIVFSQTAIIPCCCSPNHNYSTAFISNFDGKNFDVDKYMQYRSYYLNMLKNGLTPQSCIGCQNLQKKQWNESFKIKRIIITNRTKCSCNCIYCSLITTSNQTKKELNTRKTYDIIPILKDMYSKNIIDKNCMITIAGGECCEYPIGELEFIIYLALTLNCRLEILSSGIFYSKAIEFALSCGLCNLKISVDSGTKITYEKIKRVKTYNKVWTNLRKYIKATNEQSQVRIKYIILPDINDNIEEAQAFISKCKEISCNNIEIAIEYNWFGKNKNKLVSQKIKDTYNCLIRSGFDISYESESIKQWLDNCEKGKRNDL